MEKSNFIEKNTDDLIKKKKEAVIFFDDNYHSFTFQKSLVTLENGIIVSADILEESTFLLSLISKDELFKLRLSTIPGFVLKVKDSLYYAEIPNKMNFNIVKTTHLCAYNKHECSHLLAISEENGGCSKVKDISIDFYPKSSYTSNVNDLINSKRLEKYDFITFGFETFNTPCNVFIVLNCNNYEECIKKHFEESNNNMILDSPLKNKTRSNEANNQSFKKSPASKEFWDNMHF